MFAKIYKTLVWLLRIPFYLIILIGMIALFAIQTPEIQLYISNKLINTVEQNTKHKMSVSGVNINWFDIGEINDVIIYDLKDSVMLEAQSILFDIDLFSFFRQGKVELNAVYMDGFNLNISKYADSTDFNLIAFINSLASDQPVSNDQEEFSIAVSEFGLLQGEIAIHDFTKKFEANGVLEPSHLNITMDQLLIKKIGIANDTIKLHLHQMVANETNSGLAINAMKSDIHLDSKQLILSKLHLETAKSTIGDSIAFSFSNPSNLSYFMDSVTLFLNLKNTIIHPDDIVRFNKNAVLPFQFGVSGVVTGEVNKITLKNFGIFFGNNSYVIGNAFISGLPNIKNTFLDFNVGRSLLSFIDLNDMVPEMAVYPGNISFTGNVMGFINDFVTKGEIKTNRGTVVTDLNMKSLESLENARFIGRIILSDFEIGKFIGDTSIVKKINMSATVNGKGLTRESINFYLGAVATNSEIFGNNINQLSANGRFAKNFFSGSFAIKDKNISLRGKSKIDFSAAIKTLEGTIDVEKIDFQALGFVNDSLAVKTTITMNLTNLNVNDTNGTIQFDSTSISQADGINKISRLKITSTQEKDKKEYLLEANGILANLSGNFTLTELIRDVPNAGLSFLAYFKGEANNPFDTSKLENKRPYIADFSLSGRNINTILDVLDVPLKLSRDFELEGSFYQRSDVSISLFAKADTIRFVDRIFIKNELDLHASKKMDSNSVLALFRLDSDQQVWDVIANTRKFHSESVWSNNKVDFNFSVEQPDNQSRANIKSQLVIAGDSLIIKMLPSELDALGRKWIFSHENLIFITSDKWIFQNVELLSLNQSIKVDGVYSDSLITLLNVNFENFNLGNLSAFFPKKFEGNFNGNGKFSRSSFDQPLRFESDLNITGLKFEDILVGDLSGKSSWNQQENGLNIVYQIQRDAIKTIQLDGYIRPANESNQLDLNLNFDHASLKLIEPVFSNMVSNLDGTASGKLQIAGNFNAPSILGTTQIQNGKFRLDYLNTSYTFNGLIESAKDSLKLKNINIKDRFGNNATLSGNIFHKDYQEWAVNVILNHQNFELLNTLKTQNSLYYGNAYGTGFIIVSGPINNILIKANASTSHNTRLYIPVTESTAAVQEGYISFQKKIEVGQEVNEEKKISSVDMSGIMIDFDLDITQDAYAELIFDPRTGDIIRGRGIGNIQLKIGSNGEFELFGGLQIKEGAYNFTTTFVNKEFKIVPDGTISWFGDPYEGQLNLQATYRQLADPNEWNPNTTSAPGGTVSQRSPVLVVLTLNGPMMSPEISFKLELEESTNVSTDAIWRQLLATVNNNEEELKRQVFSLLLLRKFSPQNSYFIAGANVKELEKSVSEFVSNQLSYWLNQVDDKLEIDIDLNNMDQETFNTFQLRLAYTFLDGRLRVTRGGGLTTVVDNQNTTSMANILGDWSVEYLLTNDGRLRAKVFSRMNQFNQGGSSALQDQQQQTGVSVQLVNSFDEFKELMVLSRERNKAQPQENQ